MTRELDLATTATIGVTRIFSARTISRIIGLIGGLVVIRLLSPEEYGLVAIAMILPNLFILFSELEIGTALIKHLSEYRSSNELGKIKHLFSSSIVFLVILNLILTAICYFSAEMFASLTLGRPYLAPMIQIASISIFVGIVFTLSTDTLIGLDLTRKYAWLLMFMETAGAILPIVLVVAGMGAFGVILGNVISMSLASSIGFGICFITVSKLTGNSPGNYGLVVSMKKLLKYALPLASAGLVLAGVYRYFDFLIGIFSNPIDIGCYAAAVKVVTMGISYVTIPINITLLPTFSKIDPIREPKILKKTYEYSVKYSSLIVIPIAAYIIILADPITQLLFGSAYKKAGLYLALMTIQWLYYGMGIVHLDTLLRSQAKTRFIAKVNILNAVIGFILGLILIPSFGVLGLIATYLTMVWPVYFIIRRMAYKTYQVKPPLRSVGSIYASTAISCLPILLLNLIIINYALKIIAGLMVGIIVYLLSLSITRVIKRDDVENLTTMTQSYPIISKIISKILGITLSITRS